jgi:hypothetical protein
VAQSTQAAHGEPGRPKRKGVLVASIVGLVLVASAGWWAMNEHRARLQAEAKAAVELAAAAEAKAQVETITAAQARSAAEAKAAEKAAAEAKATAEGKAVAEAKATEKAKAAAEAAQRKQDEEQRKLMAERERRESEGQRKASEEVARGPLQWAESDNGSDINWSEATSYCASKGGGWRLPTVAELQDSYKTGQTTPCGSFTCKVASNSRLTGPWIWSNEPSPSGSRASFVAFFDGYQNSGDVALRGNFRALCVRRP